MWLAPVLTAPAARGQGHVSSCRQSPRGRKLFSGEDIPDEETRNDTDDYRSHLAYMAEVVEEEGTVDQLPVYSRTTSTTRRR
jgi:hypothetical protein